MPASASAPQIQLEITSFDDRTISMPRTAKANSRAFRAQRHSGTSAPTVCLTGDAERRLQWGSTNAYTEDAAGRPVYDWTILDRILDTYVQAGRNHSSNRFHAKGAIVHPNRTSCLETGR